MNDLRQRVDVISGVRNLVMQNAADVTAFHNEVAKIEEEIAGLNSNMGELADRQTTLTTYHNELKYDFIFIHT